MFTKVKNLLGVAFASFALVTVVPSVAMAQVDISAATAAIGEGQTAVLAILAVLLGAYAAFLGIRMALRVTKKGG